MPSPLSDSMRALYTPPLPDEGNDHVAEHQPGDLSESIWFSRGDSLQSSDDEDDASISGRSLGVFPHRSVSLLAKSAHQSGASEYRLKSFRNSEQPRQAQTTSCRIPTSVHNQARLSSWYLEIGAVILSFLALAVATIVFRYEDGKPISQYIFYLSLNTVVSILGTIARSLLAFALAACMGQGKWNWFKSRRSELGGFQRFDEASRGSLGSIKFLWWLQMRHWTALGAITIALLAVFDPFLQAIIYYNGELDDNSSYSSLTSISRADSLDIGTWRYDSEETMFISSLNATFNAATTFPDFGLSAAVYNGFSTSVTQQNTDYKCSSGNCTWPIYTSLAVCSVCSNLDSYINKSSGFGNGDEAEQADGNLGEFEANYTRYDIPFATNLHMMNVNGFCDYPCTYELMTAKPTADPQQTITFQNLTTMLLAVGLMRANSSYSENRSAWEETQVQATECALYLCARAYSSRVQDNLLYEDVLGSWTNREPNSWQPAPAANQAMGPGSNMTSIDEVVKSFNGYLYWGSNASLAITMTDLQIVIPENLSISSDWDGDPLPSNITRSFNISQSSIASTINFLLSMWSLGNNSQTDQFDIYFSPARQYVFTAPIMQALYLDLDPTSQFENVANSISNYVRGLGEHPQAGAAQIWVTHIHVRWGFIALPAFVVVAGFLFTLFSIIETRRLGLPAWKENVIYALIHALDEKTRALIRGAGVKEEQRAKKTMVRLVDDHDGLELKS